MPKRKKYPRLPNKFGSIKYLGKNRTNPYGVYPPTTEFTVNGVPVTQPALAYVNDWYVGFSVLMSYHAGTYVPGQLPATKDLAGNEVKGADDLIKRILGDYSQVKRSVLAEEEKEPEKTFEEVYKEFYKYKYEDDKSRTYSESSKHSTAAAFKNCKALHDKTFRNLRHDDLQDVINGCPLKHASLELIVNLFRQMYAYADMKDLIDKDYSAHLKINKPDDDESGIPFTTDELKILWDHKDDPTVEFILIMCYSGYRVKAYESMEVNLIEKYFLGGVKNRSSKERIVPIHSAILPLVQKRITQEGCLLKIKGANSFRAQMYKTLRALKIEKHTPHDCRHTFSKLCEDFQVNENDRKRMLGHSFGSDITNRLYGHRDIEDLRTEIEKIKVCC